MRLSELKPGKKATITQIQETGPARKRLLDMGLVKGSKLQIICSAPLGDPIEIEVRDYKLTLRKREAENIIVMEENT
ncbi:MAG: FeoA family protein [Candidatus Bathyarchaeia archaeon]